MIGKALAKGLVLMVCLTMLSAPRVMAQDFCQGDFTYDGDVDADDVTEFLNHFGRDQYYLPCPPDGPAPVEKTGQTTQYLMADDGHLEKGVAWPNPRFTDNGNGTVTDNLTGLIWLKNANCFGARSWNNAISDCFTLSTGNCGLADGSSLGDWRLPNSNELASLLHKGYYNLAMPDTAGTGQWSEGDPFTNVQWLYYWSSTTYASSTGSAWVVYMYYGNVLSSTKTDTNYVWAVRGGR